MQPLVIDRAAWFVGLSLCLSVTIVIRAKTAEPIEMTFGIWTRVGRRKRALGGGAHCRHLANAIAPSMCGGDAACCRTTLSTCCGFVQARYRRASRAERASIHRARFAATARWASPENDARSTSMNVCRRLAATTAPAWMTSGNSSVSASTVCHFHFRFRFNSNVQFGKTLFTRRKVDASCL